MAVQKKAAGKKKGDWDDEENEAQSISFAFKKCADDDYKGDRILGVLLSKRQVPNKLSSEKDAKQWAYEVKVREGEFHKADKKRNIIEPSIELEEGDIVTVYGTNYFDPRMRGVKIGQVFGLKYVGDLEATKAGMSDTKDIRVFTPKGDDGEFEMDAEVAAAKEADDF